MPSQKAVVKSYLTDEEMSAIVESARQSGLSLSTFVKRVCLGVRLESRVDAMAVRELTHLHADMGRLGGLLKMWLTNADSHAEQARELLGQLQTLRDELARKIIQL